MNNENSNLNIISKKDIEKIRKAYNNYSISEDYLIFEIQNIMKHEDVNKIQAINKILSLVSI